MQPSLPVTREQIVTSKASWGSECSPGPCPPAPRSLLLSDRSPLVLIPGSQMTWPFFRCLFPFLSITGESLRRSAVCVRKTQNKNSVSGILSGGVLCRPSGAGTRRSTASCCHPCEMDLSCLEDLSRPLCPFPRSRFPPLCPRLAMFPETEADHLV